MNKNKTLFLFLSLFVFLIGCAPSTKNETNQITNKTEPEKIEKSIPESTQILFVYTEKANDTVAKLFGMEYQEENWQVVFDTSSCSIGKNGFAVIDEKFEGDGKSPSGIFPIGSAFGYHKNIDTDLEFIELNEDHYWVSDTSSKLYNQLINYNPNDSFSEKMRRKDHLYKYGIVIEYNTKNIQKGKGSAIFIHVERRKGSPTTGCVALSESNIKALMKWLKPNQKPLIIMGTENEVRNILNQKIGAS